MKPIIQTCNLEMIWKQIFVLPLTDDLPTYIMYADTNIFHGNIFEDAKLSMNNDAIKYNELNPKCEITFGHIWFKHFLIIYNKVKHTSLVSTILNALNLKSTPFTIHVSKISIT